MHILTSFKNTFVEMSLFIAFNFNWLVVRAPEIRPGHERLRPLRGVRL